MSITRIVTTHCDGCGNWTAEAETAKESRRLAKLAGWIRVKGTDACAMCADKLQPDGTFNFGDLMVAPVGTRPEDAAGFELP